MADLLPIDVAKRLSRAILESAAILSSSDPKWNELLTLPRIWPLSLLLSFWYLHEKNPQVLQELPSYANSTTLFGVIFAYFDANGSLRRAVELASTGKITAASGSFNFAANKIGSDNFEKALTNATFRDLGDSLLKDIPIPEGLATEQPEGAEQAGRPASTTARVSQSPKTVPTPDLTDRDHCMAFLLGKGFSQEDAEAACQGPHKLMPRQPVKEVFTRARLLGVPILLAFSASWCGPSDRWKHEVIEQPDVAAELKKFIVNDVEVDTSKEGEDAAEQLRVTAFPTFIILGGDGHEVGRIVGYRAANRFLAWLHQFDGSHPVKPAALNGATDANIAFWQRELRKTNLSPELRQYYELLLVGNNRYAYPSQEDARAVWTAVLSGPLSDELRSYYDSNLKHLGLEA